MRIFSSFTKNERNKFNLCIELVRIIFAVLILFFHILQHSYDMTDDPVLKFMVLGDWFFVISGYVLYPYYKRYFLVDGGGVKKYIDFTKKRFLRMWPMLFIGIMLSTLLWAFQSFMKYRYGIPYNVMPERSILYTIYSLLFLQIFIPNSFFILPNSWAMCVEFIANLFFMFKFFIKSTLGIVFASLTGFIILFIGYKYELYLTFISFGTFGIPVIGKAILGLGYGFLVRKHEEKILSFYSGRRFIFLSFVMLLGCAWPKVPGHLDRIWLDLIFGLFLVFLTRFDIKRESKLAIFAEKGGSLTYGFYVLQGISLDFVDYILNRPRGFGGLGERYHEGWLMIGSRFLLSSFITLILAFYAEKIISKFLSRISK